MIEVNRNIPISERKFATEGTQRFSDALFASRKDGFSSFAVFPSNLSAFESAMMFATGIVNFSALIGPSGWGKTHLLKVAASSLSREHHQEIRVVPAVNFLKNDSKSEATAYLVLDNCEDCLSSVRAEQQLRLLLEKRLRLGRPTLVSFTSDQINRRIRQLVSARQWKIATLSRPAESEVRLIYGQIAENEGLILSERLLSVLARRHQGAGNAIASCLGRLKLVGSDWSSPPKELQAIGTLAKYLEGESGWDVRDHVHEVVAGYAGQAELKLDTAFVRDLSIYAMTEIVGLPESDVADYYQIDSGSVYASRTAAKSRREGPLQPIFQACFNRLYSSIDAL